MNFIGLMIISGIYRRLIPLPLIINCIGIPRTGACGCVAYPIYRLIRAIHKVRLNILIAAHAIYCLQRTIQSRILFNGRP